MLPDPLQSSGTAPYGGEHGLSCGRLARQRLAVPRHGRTAGWRGCRSRRGGRGLGARGNYDEAANHAILLVVALATDKFERADLRWRKRHDGGVARKRVGVQDIVDLVAAQLSGIIVG